MAALLLTASCLADVTLPEITQSNPFNMAGSGAVTGNGGGGGYVSWTDGNVQGCHYLGAPGTEYPWREERWDTPRTIGSLLFDATQRAFGGDIYVDTGSGYGTVPLTSFALSSGQSSLLVDLSSLLGGAGVCGVKVVVNNSMAEDHYQIGEMAIFSQPVVNLSQGATTVYEGGKSYAGGGSVTDMDLNSRWRADNNGDVNAVGFVVPGDQTIDVRGIRVSSGSYDGAGYGWHDFAVQITYDGDRWEFLRDAEGDIFFANTPSNVSLAWIDFGQTLTGVKGIRLYGDDVLGNNPRNFSDPNGGWLVEEILAYNVLPVPPVPEPATMSLLALGGLALLRRRR